MILICDLGLSLKKHFLLSENTTDKNDFLADKSVTEPMGEGYEFARILSSFGESHSFLSFIGGAAGADIQDYLRDSLTNLIFIPIKEKSSEHIFLEFLDKKIKIRDKQPKITRDEISKFYSEYKEGLNIYDLICLVGEHPLNIPDDMLYNMVDLSSKWGRRILLGVKDKSFKSAIEAVPYALMLNKSILEDITNLVLDFENEMIKACSYLFDKGIKHILIDNNENGLIILNEKFGYRLSVPSEYRIKRLSYGGVLGGFSLSINRNYDMEILCKLSYACGLVDFAYKDIELEATDIKALMKVIELTKFNNI